MDNAGPILIVGGTGDVGRRLLSRLGGRADVRALARSDTAAERLGLSGAEIVRGDLADAASLRVALDGVRRVFLVSSPAREQVEIETNAIEAAEAAGVERIVRISNIAVPGLDHGLHGSHRAVEARLAASPVAATVLRPTVFASFLTRQIPVLAAGRFVAPFGEALVPYVHPGDIADVACAALLDDRDVGDETLQLTGPSALSASEVATVVSEVTGVPVRAVDPGLDRWSDTVVAQGMDPWLAESAVALYRSIAAGAFADISPDIERVLGRPPTALAEYVRTELAPLLAEAVVAR